MLAGIRTRRSCEHETPPRAFRDPEYARRSAAHKACTRAGAASAAAVSSGFLLARHGRIQPRLKFLARVADVFRELRRLEFRQQLQFFVIELIQVKKSQHAALRLGSACDPDSELLRLQLCNLFWRARVDGVFFKL